MLSWTDIETNAAAFQRRWKNDPGNELQDGQNFEREFIQIFGVDPRDGFHERPIVLRDGSTGYMDYFLPGKILIEMKSKGQSLSKAYTQAMSYVHAMKPEEVPELVMCCDFNRFEIYNLRKDHRYKPFRISQLKRHLRIFSLVAGYGTAEDAPTEIEVNVKAAYKMAKLHDKLKKSKYKGHHLEVYLVRLLFCLFAENTGIFEWGAFGEYVKNSREDGTDLSGRLADLFSTLDTPLKERSPLLPDELQRFRYIDGKLFAENLPTAHFDAEMRQILLDCSEDFDWSAISPAIFGAMFQGVMDKDVRNTLGAHYTSEENIMKVIGPLFLDDLYDEFERSKSTTAELEAFLDKLASLKFLDPAMGSGNFLIVTYHKLRELEFEVLKLLHDNRQGRIINVITKVSVSQFYGIEYEDFPCEIAKTSMILIKHLMDQEVSNYFGTNYIDFPIKENANIVQGNALEIDWEDVVPKHELNYIIGNPPFKGYSNQNPRQKAEMRNIYKDSNGKTTKKAGKIDYVAAWFYKAAQYMQGTQIETAFVATNSIVQGEQVEAVWEVLYDLFNVNITHAFRDFKWSNDAKDKAQVHCVVIGFKSGPYLKPKKLWDSELVLSEPANINAYLMPAKNIIIKSRRKPLCDVSPMVYGSKPADGGFLIMTAEEKDLAVARDQRIEPFIKPYFGARDFIEKSPRYCLWLKDISPSDYANIREVTERLEGVRATRLKSHKTKTIEDASTPMLFQEIRQPTSNYLLVPRVSSEKRDYIPIGFMSPDAICGDQNLMIPNATLYEFGVLSSKAHMAWMKMVAGRLKSDYRYSASIVYNTFPWPDPTPAQKAEVEKTAQMILDARAQQGDMSYAVMYNHLHMPLSLLRAHQANNKAVRKAYNAEWEDEEACLDDLINRYQKLIEEKGR